MFPTGTNEKVKKQIIHLSEISRPQVSNPKTKPRLYKYLKYALLVAFVVLLVAQLCANELSGAIAATTFNNVRFNSSVDLAKRNSVNFLKQFKDKGLDDNLVNGTIQLGSGNGTKDLPEPPDRPAVSNSSAQDSDKQVELSAGDQYAQYQAHLDLQVAPTANTAQVDVSDCSAASCQPKEEKLNGEHLTQLDTSLAELTAAGTAAGLLVHDLISQANTLPEQDVHAQTDSQPYNVYLPPLGDLGSSNVPYAAATGLDTDDNERALGYEARQIDQPIYNSIPLHKSRQIEAVDDDEAEQSSGEGHQDVRYENERHNHVNPTDHSSSSLERSAASQAESSPEPPGEDQMPDSMDSLMKSEGENIDDDSVRDQRQPQMDGSTLVNQNRQVTSDGDGTSQVFPVLNGMQDRDDEDDNDSDDDENRPRKGAEIALKSAPSPLHISSSGEFDPSYMDSVSDQLRNKGLMPATDSLSDLNTAAGHYYGKKKKKKVKKIVIKKKKKKKKKKYVKKKKVKVVKIVHKKKKKSKGKKHHDHGHYYMYAKVPKKKTWEFGFKKGNKKHWIMRHEKGHKNKFKTKVKWYDKKSKGKGVHIWDYNHHDKKKKKHY